MRAGRFCAGTLFLSGLALLLQACGGPPPMIEEKDAVSGQTQDYVRWQPPPVAPQTYELEQDRAPSKSIDPSEIHDAVPRNEPITIAGNKSPYKVLGKTYRLLPTCAGYKEKAKGSWYGQKFHGKKTSNGEIYSMYGMTAAHKTLPIPCYAKVTNLDNGKSTIVRINDRGPFHDGRIIDLSYAAAVKLGYANKGTANVLVEGIDTSHLPGGSEAADIESMNAALMNFEGKPYIQAGAFKSRQSAEKLKKQIRLHTTYPVNISTTASGFHRVRVGPVNDTAEKHRLLATLTEAGFTSVIPVKP